jgi:photosystem II stability/assembly factor-like uncharacterized protein
MKIKTFLFLFCLSLVLKGYGQSEQIAISTAKSDTQVKKSAGYSWYPANTGGGGYIIGFVQDPKSPELLYARCDVGGVFKTTDGGRHWKACNNGLSKWYNHSVRSIAISPSNSQVIFRCSGDIRNKTLYGSIHKSIDGGQTWKEVCTKVGYFGNGPGRMYGELIAVDPFDESKVITAGYSNGIWVSDDGGETWNYREASNERFSAVAIHPYFSGTYLAATVDGKLYQSSDKGKSWKVIYHSTEFPFVFTELAFDKINPKVIYASTHGEGINVSRDGGRSFSKINKGLPEKYGFNTITTDPANTSILYTAPDTRPDHKLAPVPVYKSVNAGDSWELIASHDWSTLKNFPSYMREPVFVGWAISKVRVDVRDSRNLLISNWYGVSVSNDGGLTYDGYNFNGLETNCLENISFFPNNSWKAYYTVADHMPMISNNGGESYTALPKSKYSSSTALTVSRRDTSFILFGSRSHGSAGIYSSRNGKNTLLKDFHPGYIQALTESPTRKGTFYAYVDGITSESAGLYKSTNWGTSWEKLKGVFPSYLKTLPHNAPFIENELLNIVVGQVKNVCGANQLLCADSRGGLYAGEWTEGIFKSTDEGKTWKNMSKGLPFHKDTASVLTVIKTDPKRKDWVYAGFVREGLWRSTNGGATWTKVYPLDNSIFNVSSVHVGGVSGDELYIASENLHWANSPVSVLLSKDTGKTWQNIYDTQLGALRIKSIDVHRKSGRIILATSGNGAFYGVRIKE